LISPPARELRWERVGARPVDVVTSQQFVAGALSQREVLQGVAL